MLRRCDNSLTPCSADEAVINSELDAHLKGNLQVGVETRHKHTMVQNQVATPASRIGLHLANRVKVEFGWHTSRDQIIHRFETIRY